MITKLYIKTEKGQPATRVDSIRLIEGLGIEGDCHSGDPDRAICFITEDTGNKLSKINKKYNCLARFSCNMVLSGDREYRVGDIIKAGTAELEISIVGRECHKLCELPHCPLIYGIIFARIKKGGTIKTGDEEIYA